MKRLPAATLGCVVAVALLAAGCSNGGTSNPSTSGTTPTSASTPASTPTASATGLEAELVKAATGLQLTGETKAPVVTFGTAARTPLIQLRQAVSVKPEDCRIVGIGVAALVETDTPFVQAVYGTTTTSVSVVQAKDEAAAKAFIAERDRQSTTCSKITLTTSGTSAEGTISYPKVDAKVSDGQVMQAAFTGQSGITQVMGRKGQLIFIAVGQAKDAAELTRMIEVAVQFEKALPAA